LTCSSKFCYLYYVWCGGQDVVTKSRPIANIYVVGKHTMTIRAITIVTMIIGIGLLIYSLTMPYYTDSKKADELLTGVNSLDKKEYYKKEAELRTNKVKLMDFGAGLAIASGTVLLFLLSFKIKEISDFNKVKTMNKIMVFISSNLIWLLLIPGTYWYYTFRGGRGDYPPFADSIGIPLMTEIPFYFMLMIPLNLFLILTTYKAKLPTLLFIFADKKETSVILTEIFFGFWLFLNLFFMLTFIYDGDHFSVFVNIFFTYILLTLRAGQISKWTQ
jgi:hypothetical protein